MTTGCKHHSPPDYCQCHGRRGACPPDCADRSDGKTDRGRHERRVGKAMAGLLIGPVVSAIRTVQAIDQTCEQLGVKQWKRAK